VARFFLLADELEQARRRQFNPSDPGWSEYVWARSAYEAADRFREVAADRHAILLLLEEATWLAAVATAKRAHASEAKLDPDSLLQTARGCEPFRQRVDALSESDRAQLVRTLSERCASARTTANPPSAEDLRARIRWLRALAGQLLTPLDQDAEISLGVKRRRIARIGGPVLLVAVILGLVVYLLVRALAPEPINHALNKPVTCSSEENPKQLPRRALVDGDTSAKGAATRRQSNPWMQIDLGKPVRIQQVIVYNAAPQEQQALSLLLFLEISTNGKKWKRLASRAEPFAVWKYAPKRPSRTVRYLRLRVKAKQAQLRLREVVVH
jgi:hypothetical protein